MSTIDDIPFYVVVPPSCNHHPETCTCYPFEIKLDGETVAKGVNKDKLNTLAGLANKSLDLSLGG